MEVKTNPKWQRDWRTLYLLNDAGVNRFDMTVQPGWQDEEKGRTKYFECEEMAESILRAVNSHEALVAALEEAVAFIEHFTPENLDSFGAFAIRTTVDRMRAAIAAARAT